MGRTEAAEQYAASLRQGKKTYRKLLLQGAYPYLQVLDELVDESMVAGRVDLGVVEIPIAQIAGTVTAGRRTAFAADFMPLLGTDTEFCEKWVSLCQAHLEGEGIRDPVRCSEYLGRFYVQEGNKRVSVLKSYGALTIPSHVTRLVPSWSEDLEIQAYYDFMRSYALTGLYSVRFSRPGRFEKLQAALGRGPEDAWSEEDRRHFSACFTRFQKALSKQAGNGLPGTEADALLVWLKVYPLEALTDMDDGELKDSLSAVWGDVKLSASDGQVSVTTEAREPEKPAGPAAILGRLVHTVFPKQLNIAFISDLQPEDSDWARAHDLGRQYLETVMPDRVRVQVFSGTGCGEGADAAFAQAKENGAQLVCATTPRLIGACRRASVRFPGLHILNCAVSMPFTGIRTYYSRIYEGKFVTGAIAGALSRDGRIGYVASNPIFGVPASINAFALGAQMTNPEARIELRWSCVEEDAFEALLRDGVKVVSNRDVPSPDRMREPWGLCCALGKGKSLHSTQCLASPYWHWGKVYVRLASGILSGAWDALDAGDKRAVNYWWGMQSGAVGVQLSPDLPEGVRQLAETLCIDIAAGRFTPFDRPLTAQNGSRKTVRGADFTPEDILGMDWLCENVTGSIPPFESLLPMARPLARLQAIYRDSIPPEKEEDIL